MQLIDSRRLTGPNLLWDRPSAVIDVHFDDADPETVIVEWQHQVRRVLDAVGWSGEQTCVRRYAQGASLAISAPPDVLYAATDVNDWAWEATLAALTGTTPPSLEHDAERLRGTIASEHNPGLLTLLEVAAKRGLPALYDDDAVCIGLGRGSRCWPRDELPPADRIDWSGLATIPVALVTGTNGKTTTVRLTSAMVRAAALNAGISSTDWVSVNDEILERGDFSGPGGARTVLRDRRVDVAVLETARGGLLRRGLAVERATAALITNVAEDHLGEFALANLDELADVKWVVTRALRDGGRLILNADDPHLRARARDGEHAITWFSRQADNLPPKGSGDTCTVEKGCVVLYSVGQRHELLAVTDIPVTLGGAAVHNVSNALGAAALGHALGLPIEAIVAGLRGTRDTDNPGRCNLYQLNGVQVLIDFAHNPHGLQALFELADKLPAVRKLLVIGQAGDRTDDAIRKLVRVAWAIQPARVIIKELSRYARGREEGEVARMMREEFLRLGAPADTLRYREHELDAVREAVAWARRGDLLILLVHEDLDAVVGYLDSQQESSA